MNENRENSFLSEWSIYNSGERIKTKYAASSLPALSCDLSKFANCQIAKQKKSVFSGKKANLLEHYQKLESEFAGASRLSHLLACTIVVIRRTDGKGPGVELFNRIITEFGDQVASELNLRWLTSYFDTITDIGTPAQKGVALACATLANIVKIYETELKRCHAPIDWPPTKTYDFNKQLFDGVIPFGLMKGNLVDNMLIRFDNMGKSNPEMAPFIDAMFYKLHTLNTVFHRIIKLREAPINSSDEDLLKI